MKINLISKPNSTAINNQNKTVLDVVFNHKIYSIKRVNKKYSKPIAKNKMAPLSNSLV